MNMGGRSIYLTCRNKMKCASVSVLSFSIVSTSLWPHALQPTRLPCPWDFPGKNTGAGCHFLLQGIFLTLGSKLHLCISCISRQAPYHCVTWESPICKYCAILYKGLEDMRIFISERSPGTSPSQMPMENCTPVFKVSSICRHALSIIDHDFA